MIFLSLGLLLAQSPVVVKDAWVRGGAEVGLLNFPREDAQQFLGTLTPVLGFGVGEDFSLELGVPLRFQLSEEAANTPLGQVGRLVRREDWDERGDYGQLLRQLRWGAPGQVFHLQAGPFSRYTLGHGHLINRYSNVDNPDYHPAGVHSEFYLGATRTQAFVSDVFGARLFALDVATDLGRAFSKNPKFHDVWHVSVSAATDRGESRMATPSMSAMHVDFDATFYREKSVTLTLLSGAGARLFAPPADWGALLGVMLDTRYGPTEWGLKFEGRRQQGLFRQGLFGPNHELGRYSGLGQGAAPLAREVLPAGFSGYAEVRFASGPLSDESRPFRMALSMAVEAFSSTRTDGDVSLALTVGKAFSATLRAQAVGLGVRPRVTVQTEARYRLAPSVYVLGNLGNAYFPQADGTLLRGVYGGLGLGLDFES
jgi:hypothetical protein